MSDNKKVKEEAAATPVMRFKGWFKDIAGEFKKIIWPDKKTLVKHTFNVILVSGVIGAVIIVMDLVFSSGYSWFVGFFG